MKNYSKDNYSQGNSNKDKKKSQSKNNYKFNNFQENINNFSKNNRFERTNFKKRENIKSNEFGYLKSKDNEKKNYMHPEGISHSKKNNSNKKIEYSHKKNQIISNDRALDDWIWGKHSVYSALNSERPINRIWCTSDIFSSEKFFLLLKDHKSKGVLIEEVTWSRISQLTLGAVHQGIALQLASSKTVTLKKLIDISLSKTSNPIVVALDGITDPHNLGAIIRSAEAFNCNGIIIPQRRSAGLTGTVAKVAAGALEHIPVCRVVNLNRAIDELKKNRFLAIGLSGDGKVTITDFNQKAPLVVIIGSENKGISLLTQRNCDFLLKIPLKGKTSSLNASVAAAISLYQLSNY